MRELAFLVVRRSQVVERGGGQGCSAILGKILCFEDTLSDNAQLHSFDILSVFSLGHEVFGQR